MTGLNVVPGAISSKLDTAAYMGEELEVTKSCCFSLRPESETILRQGFGKYKIHSLPSPSFPIPSENWDDKLPKNTTRPGINPTSSSPPPSFNPQPVWPHTGKIPLI